MRDQAEQVRDAVTSTKTHRSKATSPPAVTTSSVLVCPSSGRMDWDVVGESHYLSNIVRAVRGKEGERFMRVGLEREPKNKYDSNAIKVTIKGMTVGYIPSELTAEFHPLLLAAERAKIRVEADGRVWYSRRDGGIGSVSFSASDPGLAWPINPSPNPSATAVWPRGTRLKVSFGDDEQATVHECLDRAYQEGKCAAYLRLELPETGSRIRTTFDGRPLGSLSAAASADVAEALKMANSVGRSIYVVAEIVGNRLSSKVNALIKPANELSNAEVNALIAPVEEAAVWAPPTVD